VKERVWEERKDLLAVELNEEIMNDIGGMLDNWDETLYLFIFPFVGKGICVSRDIKIREQ